MILLRTARIKPLFNAAAGAGETMSTWARHSHQAFGAFPVFFNLRGSVTVKVEPLRILL